MEIDFVGFSAISRQLVLCHVAAVKRLPIHYRSADYIFWSFGIIEFIFRYFKIEFHLDRCYGAWPALYTSLLVMNRPNKTKFAIFISLMWSLLPRDLSNQNLFIFSAASVLSYNGCKTSPRTSSQCIIYFLVI